MPERLLGELAVLERLASPRASARSDALRYLGASPRLAWRLAPAAPGSPAEARRLAEGQADAIVTVITSVLEGLELPHEQRLRGQEFAAQALRRFSAEGGA